MVPILDGGSAQGTPSGPSGLATTTEILLLAGNQLEDATGVKWTADAMVPYLNMAIAAIVKLQPQALPTLLTLNLIAGTAQYLPSNTRMLLDVVCNISAQGVPGTVPGKFSRKKMDMLLPDWQTWTANAIVQFVLIDDDDPFTIYTFPPQPAANRGALQLKVSQMPNDIVNTDDPFPLDISYRNECVDYLIYRALFEETTIPNAVQKAQQALQNFSQAMGVTIQQVQAVEQEEK
jgi:hypothetical protein